MIIHLPVTAVRRKDSSMLLLSLLAICARVCMQTAAQAQADNDQNIQYTASQGHQWQRQWLV